MFSYVLVLLPSVFSFAPFVCYALLSILPYLFLFLNTFPFQSYLFPFSPSASISFLLPSVFSSISFYFLLFFHLFFVSSFYFLPFHIVNSQAHTKPESSEKAFFSSEETYKFPLPLFFSILNSSSKEIFFFSSQAPLYIKLLILKILSREPNPLLKPLVLPSPFCAERRFLFH